MSVMLNASLIIILQANESFFWLCFVPVMYPKNTSGTPKQEPARYAPRYGHGQSVEYRFLMFMWIKQFFCNYVLKVTHFFTKAIQFEVTC